MAEEGGQFRSVLVPQLHRVVSTGGGKGLAIGAETDAQNGVLMTEEGGQFRSVPVPQLYRAVPTGGGKGLAIGAETNAPDGVLMAGETVPFSEG